MSGEFLLGVPGKLKTLLDRLTATRAANLDDLDTTISSRAPSSTALSTATWTNARAAKLDNLDALVSSGGIKSVQRFENQNIASPNTYKDHTLSPAVNLSKCWPIVVSQPTAGSADPIDYMLITILTGTTTLRVSRYGNTGTVVYSVYLIEFN